MNLALIGYGKMGREIEKSAIEKGHDIILKIDKGNRHELDSAEFRSADVAIEFTTPETAFENIRACFIAGVPVVCGTTGWTDRMDEAERLCSENGQAFFYASNFSIGVNILFRLNRWLAGAMNKFPEYEVEASEVHHIHKKDAPSGTAIKLAEEIISGIDRKTGWENGPVGGADKFSVLSERTGEVPGDHTVRYISGSDILEIKHRSLTRRGFASGAIMAAEYIKGKKGVFKMDDLLNI